MKGEKVDLRVEIIFRVGVELWIAVDLGVEEWSYGLR